MGHPFLTKKQIKFLKINDIPNNILYEWKTSEQKHTDR